MSSTMTSVMMSGAAMSGPSDAPVRPVFLFLSLVGLEPLEFRKLQFHKIPVLLEYSKSAGSGRIRVPTGLPPSGGCLGSLFYAFCLTRPGLTLLKSWFCPWSEFSTLVLLFAEGALLWYTFTTKHLEILARITDYTL